MAAGTWPARDAGARGGRLETLMAGAEARRAPAALSHRPPGARAGVAQVAYPSRISESRIRVAYPSRVSESRIALASLMRGGGMRFQSLNSSIGGQR